MSKQDSANENSSRIEHLREQLGKLRFRARLNRVLVASAWGLGAGALLTAALVVVERLAYFRAVPLDQIAPFAGLAVLLFFLVRFGLMPSISSLELLVRADETFDEKELLSSAWAFEEQGEDLDSPLVNEVLERADRHAEKLEPAAVEPVRFRRGFALVGVALLLAVGSYFLPYAGFTGAATAQRETDVVKEQAKELKELSKEIDQQRPELDEQARQQIQQKLEEKAAEFEEGRTSPDDAIRELGRLENEIEKIAEESDKRQAASLSEELEQAMQGKNLSSELENSAASGKLGEFMKQLQQKMQQARSEGRPLTDEEIDELKDSLDALKEAVQNSEMSEQRKQDAMDQIEQAEQALDQLGEQNQQNQQNAQQQAQEAAQQARELADKVSQSGNEQLAQQLRQQARQMEQEAQSQGGVSEQTKQQMIDSANQAQQYAQQQMDQGQMSQQQGQQVQQSAQELKQALQSQQGSGQQQSSSGAQQQLGQSMSQLQQQMQGMSGQGSQQSQPGQGGQMQGLQGQGGQQLGNQLSQSISQVQRQISSGACQANPNCSGSGKGQQAQGGSGAKSSWGVGSTARQSQGSEVDPSQANRDERQDDGELRTPGSTEFTPLYNQENNQSSGFESRVQSERQNEDGAVDTQKIQSLPTDEEASTEYYEVQRDRIESEEQAMNRSELPPAYKEMVKGYFDQISGSGAEAGGEADSGESGEGESAEGSDEGSSGGDGSSEGSD